MMRLARECVYSNLYFYEILSPLWFPNANHCLPIFCFICYYYKYVYFTWYCRRREASSHSFQRGGSCVATGAIGSSRFDSFLGGATMICDNHRSRRRGMRSSLVVAAIRKVVCDDLMCHF